ncbi:MAG: NfeD family protein, partial [Eubacterium sp.]|nr:NfeD family protein [Eubacterium sp.]
DGKVWTARSSDKSIIPKDSIVTVEKIDGVKLIVSAK